MGGLKDFACVKRLPFCCVARADSQVENLTVSFHGHNIVEGSDLMVGAARAFVGPLSVSLPPSPVRIWSL